MKRALFIVSEDGQGHKVRCGALADELTARGWITETVGALEGVLVGPADVLVVDAPATATANAGGRLVEIVDVPTVVTGADLVVCGNAGVRPGMFEADAKRTLAGPEYALLRRVFREQRGSGDAHDGGSYLASDFLDLRGITKATGAEIARWLRKAKHHGQAVVTYGGMRALEAACVLEGSEQLFVRPRNDGERLNADGLAAGARVDGYGCVRVADAIEALFQ